MDTVNIMKAEGYKFPPLKESDAMFSADTAPEWSDGDVCHRCRTGFSLMMRKHHCRACGQVFCQQCSSKTSTIPKFGIEKEVRVCDACFDKVSRPPSAAAAGAAASAKLDSIDTASDYGPALHPQKRAGGAGSKTAEELQEEEELQLALALSQSEAEHKEKEHKRPAAVHHNLSPTPSSMSASPEHHANVAESELSRYLDRNYWEQRRDTSVPRASAPPATSTQSHADNIDKVMSYNSSGVKSAQSSQEEDADSELEQFVAALKSQVEIFVNRMKSDSSRGRSIANDTSVQTLFMNITAMHSQLLRYIQLQDDKRVHYESLQDKVSQTRDSRAALDTLRTEHAARLAAAAEAAERQRQMQMAHKLHTMRKKKHEYLQYQRQLALQRVQEQEREMQMRQEQQKQQYLMSGTGYFIQGSPMTFQHGFQQQQVFPNPQYHQGMPTDQSQIPQQPPISQPSVMMGQTMSAMARQGNPAQIPQMMMHQLRMPMSVHGMPGSVSTGQPGAPQQNVGNINLQKQPQVVQSQGNLNPQHQLGQTMGQQPNAGGMLNVHVQMGGMRAPGIQGQQMPMQQQLSHQGGQNQMQLPNVPPSQGQMSMPNQIQPQVQTMQGQMQQGQQLPQQGQQMPQQGQQMPQQGQQMPQQGQQMSQQGQQMSQQGQQMPQQSQQIPQGQHMPQQGQQMPQGQQMQHGQQMPQQGHHMSQQGQQQIQSQGQPMPPQGQQIQPQGQPLPNQAQQIPQSQGPQQLNQQMNQVRPPGAPTASQPIPNNFAPTQQPPAPLPASAPAPPKSENNTAELISFD